MQVVYSGGTSTPVPSPNVKRKFGYSRPVMPGYNSHVQPQIMSHSSSSGKSPTGGEKLTEGDTDLRSSIPLMSKRVAVVCLILNIFVPGSGTFTAGLSVLCCSKVRPHGSSKRHCVWMNSWVALIQFLLTFLFLLGWIWSITWGVAFLNISRQHRKRQNNGRHRHQDNIESKGHGKIYDTSRNLPQSTDSGGSKQSRHHSSHHSSHHSVHQQNVHQISHNLNNNNRSNQNINEIKRSRTPSPNYRESTPKSNGSSWNMTHTLDPSTRSGNRTPSPSSFKNDSLTTVPRQPIIVLQKVSDANQMETKNDVTKNSPNDTIMQARTRHMKMLQRKMSDNDLSPFVLTNKQLEAIVIHDLPLVSSSVPRNNAIEEETTGLPKMELV